MYSILVVDDSPFIVDVFVTMLERGGYRTVAAYGGEECLEILKTVTPDLILLDIMMEPMDGWVTLEKIKENPQTKEIPVLMLTAKQLTPAEAQEYGIYIEDYVLKPITHRELYDAIEHVLARRQSIKTDMDMARQSGFDSEIITEYARLSKSIDVNKRLMKILQFQRLKGQGQRGDLPCDQEHGDEHQVPGNPSPADQGRVVGDHDLQVSYQPGNW